MHTGKSNGFLVSKTCAKKPFLVIRLFDKEMAELGFAIVWISPGIDQQWDVTKGCQKAFDHMLEDFARVSGYSELEYVPVVPLGHSAMATFPWNFAAWNPEKNISHYFL